MRLCCLLCYDCIILKKKAVGSFKMVNSFFCFLLCLNLCFFNMVLYQRWHSDHYCLLYVLKYFTNCLIAVSFPECQWRSSVTGQHCEQSVELFEWSITYCETAVSKGLVFSVSTSTRTGEIFIILEEFRHFFLKG